METPEIEIRPCSRCGRPWPAWAAVAGDVCPVCTTTAAVDEMEARMRMLVADLIPTPLASWKTIAVAVGVSYETLHRRRREAEDETEPYFLSAEDARAWYRKLVAPAPKPARRGRRKTAKTGAVDWGKVGRGEG